MQKLEEQIDVNNGQSFVILQDENGKEIKKYVSYIVAETFDLPNPNNYKYIIHKDKNKQNNQFSNLEWSEFPEDKLYFIK